MRARTPIGTFLVLAVFLAVPSAAAEPSCRLIRGAETPEDPTDDVQVCRQDVWFHAATFKPGNLAGMGQDQFPSWNTTAPAGSVTSGAGGGYFTNSALHQGTEPYDPRATATFEGKFAGDIDSLGVTLYAFFPLRRAPLNENVALNVRLLVDEQPILDAAQIVPKRVVAGQEVLQLRFAPVNLYQELEFAGVALGPGVEHTVRLSVVGTFLVNDPGLFVYDTTEVPSGMAFNIEPENLGTYTILDPSGG